MEPMERLLRELRARRLDRVAVGYAVAGWLLVQAASIALPSFDAAPWVLRAVIIFTLLGFPLALAIAWFAAPHIFEVHSHRVHLKPTHAVLFAIAVVVVAVAADLSYLLSRLPAETPASVAVGAPPPMAENSIAVLPFLNMSGDPAKEYFSDGMSEELLNDLANTPELLVAARTSSFAFKGRSENIKDIARILSVRSVLEGSVRESGQHLRITGQLINAADGFHLWSATYDRDLTDVLVVQQEIAQAITAALTHRLLPRDHPAAPQTAHAIDGQAYEAYLLGKQQLGPRTEAGSEAALVSFQKTTALAPDFADGFAALARAQINVAEYHPERSNLIPEAQDALARALALDPRNVNALSTRLDLALHKLDWQAAIADARLMQQISPNSAQVLHELFRFYTLMGFPDLAFASASGAAKLDPLSFVERLNMTSFLLHHARYSEAIAAANTALAMEHGEPLTLSMQCVAAAYGNVKALARSTETKLVAAGDPADLQFCRFAIAIAERRYADSRAVADQLAQSYQHGGLSAFEIGKQYAIAGDDRKAFLWFNRSYTAKEFQLFVLSGDKIMPPAFFESPAWKAFYRRPLFDDWRKAHDTIAAELVARG